MTQVVMLTDRGMARVLEAEVGMTFIVGAHTDGGIVRKHQIEHLGQ